jgi:hypothetical protein
VGGVVIAMLWLVPGAVAVGLAVWWGRSAPRCEIGDHIAGSLAFDEATERAIQAVDHSAEFACSIQALPADLPPYDDAVIFPKRGVMVATGHDGKIWQVRLDTFEAEAIADTQQMAWGIHELPGSSNQVYFCAAGYYGRTLPGAAPGVYRLTLDTGVIEPIVLRVPSTTIDHAHPVVYADDDPQAPRLGPGSDSRPSRAIGVADSLEVSEDGKRIYFSEPFAYPNADLDDAVDEAIALSGNGRLWQHDIETGVTRLVAEGFHFINGVLYDPPPSGDREESVIVSQTSLFRLTRFHLRGPKAGTAEVVIDSLPGTPDGIDRDAAGRIWLSMFIARSKLLTFIHRHAWLKPLLMRLPARLLASQGRRTGVVVMSADGGTALYSGFHSGPGLASISSAVPAPDGIYLANVALGGENPERKHIQRLSWPPELGPPTSAFGGRAPSAGAWA